MKGLGTWHDVTCKEHLLMSLDIANNTEADRNDGRFFLLIDWLIDRSNLTSLQTKDGKTRICFSPLDTTSMQVSQEAKSRQKKEVRPLMCFPLALERHLWTGAGEPDTKKLILAIQQSGNQTSARSININCELIMSELRYECFSGNYFCDCEYLKVI